MVGYGEGGVGVALRRERGSEKERKKKNEGGGGGGWKSAIEPKRGKGKQMKSDTLIQRASSA